MLKEDVEKVLIKSFDYFKDILGDNIDLGELKELSDWILEGMKEELELEKEIQRNYIVSQFQLSQLIVSGKYEFKDIMGNTVVLRYEDKSAVPSILESGTMLLWDKRKYNTIDKIQEFGASKQKTIGKYQSKFINQTPKRLHPNVMNKLIDFNKNIHNIDDLSRTCTKLNLNDNLKLLQKIRSDVMHEKINYFIMDGKQKTLNDFTN